ncbi:MAG: hypothetical protein P4L35_03345 [Ignavibacteriaceae bacterium]|nr:hypothetical protein [Ignavibacteriaceae bacterium]
MKETLELINSLIDEGIILKYAIGGGIACLYYIEPTSTFDLDIFVILAVEENILNPLKPFYEWAEKKRFKFKDEHIILNTIPVQFLPVYNDLVKEGVENSRKVKIQDTDTFILSPEYLIAIMLQTNRAKDKIRSLQLYEETPLDKILLDNILKKYNLTDRLNNIINLNK